MTQQEKLAMILALVQARLISGRQGREAVKRIWPELFGES